MEAAVEESKDVGAKTIRMHADAKMLSRDYLETDEPHSVRWVYNHQAHQIKDGSKILFHEPDDFNPATIVSPGRRSWLLHFGVPALIGTALGAESIESLVDDLRSDDTAARRNARYRLAATGSPAVPAIMKALRSAPEDYIVKSSVSFSLLEMIRSDPSEKQRQEISTNLQDPDLDLLARLTGDSDKTIRTQVSEFLYRLADKRIVSSVMKAVEDDVKRTAVANAEDQNAIYNSVIVLQSVVPDLSDSDRKAVIEKLRGMIPSSFDRTQALIDSLSPSAEANGKYNVLVFYRASRRDDATQLLQALSGQGYKTSITASSLDEVAIAPQPAGTTFIVPTERGTSVADRVRTTAAKSVAPSRRDAVVLGNWFPLKRGDMQIYLY